MRIVFMGTPGFAVPSLDRLVEAGHEIASVYTQPPRPAGRGKSLQPSPVHKRAEELGIPVRMPNRLRDETEQQALARFDADLGVVAAYGLILPQPVLDAPRLGCLNVHASLLPRWRGAAPVHRAILAGDRTTGVTIMQMEAGLDTGPMLAMRETEIGQKTGGVLTQELAELGAHLLVDVLADLPSYPPMPQPEDGVCYAPKIDKSEARLDFLLSAPQTVRQIQAFAPAPGAFFEYRGERIRILAASPVLTPVAQPPGTVLDGDLSIACNPGAIVVHSVQRAGRGAMSAAEMLRGFPILAGTRLS